MTTRTYTRNIQVHMLGDLLSKADGVVAFREVMELSPALRALLVSEAGATAAAVAAGAAEGHANNPMVIGEEAKYLLVQEKLIMGEVFFFFRPVVVTALARG